MRTYLRGFLGPLRRDLPGIDAAHLLEQTNVPDDALHQAARLSELIAQTQASATPLAYAAQLIEGLAPRMLAAQTEIDEKQAALNLLRNLQAKRRDAGIAFQAELTALRQSLRVAFGSSHPDYQRLRAERTKRADVEDDGAVEASAPVAVTPQSVAPTVPASTSNGQSPTSPRA